MSKDTRQVLLDGSREGGLALPTEMVPIGSLRPHPRNYQGHPKDELEHLVQSVKSYGFYRNVVIAKDGTILAGHGMVEAARIVGMDSVPVVRLDLAPDDPRAIKVIVADNEISHLAECDDRLLTELLKEIKQSDPIGLVGTGYDEQMLANLVFVTRPTSEISDFNAAAEWAGMPSYENPAEAIKLIISFETEGDRQECLRRLEIKIGPKSRSSWFPQKQRDELESFLFTSNEEDVGDPESSEQ